MELNRNELSVGDTVVPMTRQGAAFRGLVLAVNDGRALVIWDSHLRPETVEVGSIVRWPA